MALVIEKIKGSGKNVIVPKGDIDITTSPEFKKILMGALDEKLDVTIDGSDIEYIDSTGLGVMISALRKANENEVKIIIKNIRPNIEKLFNITGLDKIFEIV